MLQICNIDSRALNMNLWLNKLILQIWLLPKGPLLQMCTLFYFHLLLAAKKQPFSYLLSIFCKNLVSDQSLFLFWDLDSIEIKMKHVLAKVDKSHFAASSKSRLKF